MAEIGREGDIRGASQDHHSIKETSGSGFNPIPPLGSPQERGQNAKLSLKTGILQRLPARSATGPPDATSSISRLALLRHEAVFEVVRDRVRVAVGGIAPTAAAAGFEDQDVAGADFEAGFLGLDRARRLAGGVERVAVGQAVGAAEDAAGAVAHAVAGGVGDRRLGGLDDHLDNPAGPAAILADAARIGAEFMAAKEQRKTQFGHFETAELDPARGLPLTGARPAVAARRRAAARPRLKKCQMNGLPPGTLERFSSGLPPSPSCG